MQAHENEFRLSPQWAAAPDARLTLSSHASLTRVDPHVHAAASSCSHLTDDELLLWFREHPEYAVVVTDHMTWRFYESPGARPFLQRAIYALEVTVENRYDFVLLTADLDALRGLLPGASSRERTFHQPPREIFADPRVLVTFAHPPQPGPRNEASWPNWLAGLPVDFLEFNAARCQGAWRPVRPGGATDTLVIELDEHLQRLRDELFPEARFIVGSDSHSAEQLGTSYLELATPCRDGREAWERLQAGSFTGRLGLQGRSYTVDPLAGATKGAG